MVKQSEIPTYFLTLSCADLRWEELPYISNKLNNLGIKKLSYQERFNLFNNNQVLVARHFQYKVEALFKEIVLDGPLGGGGGGQNIMLYALNFKTGVAHMSIHLYGFSMHQMLKMILKW